MNSTLMAVHRDDEASKIGMWIFIFTELLLFGGLFVVYSVYRHNNPVAFALAGNELDTKIGLINTIILLVSSTTLAMATSAIRKKDILLTNLLIGMTIFLAIVFMINKYIEWGAKFEHGLYPGSSHLLEISHGEILFFGLYFFMTGLHALHIIIGVIFMAVVLLKIQRRKVTPDQPVLLDNCGLYWHLVDIIWIFLFPLFYLIT